MYTTAPLKYVLQTLALVTIPNVSTWPTFSPSAQSQASLERYMLSIEEHNTLMYASRQVVVAHVYVAMMQAQRLLGRPCWDKQSGRRARGIRSITSWSVLVQLYCCQLVLFRILQGCTTSDKNWHVIAREAVLVQHYITGYIKACLTAAWLSATVTRTTTRILSLSIHSIMHQVCEFQIST